MWVLESRLGYDDLRRLKRSPSYHPGPRVWASNCSTESCHFSLPNNNNNNSNHNHNHNKLMRKFWYHGFGGFLRRVVILRYLKIHVVFQIMQLHMVWRHGNLPETYKKGWNKENRSKTKAHTCVFVTKKKEQLESRENHQWEPCLCLKFGEKKMKKSTPLQENQSSVHTCLLQNRIWWLILPETRHWFQEGGKHSEKPHLI